MKGWVCSAGNVRELFYKSLGGWEDERWLGVQRCFVPDCRAFGGEIHVGMGSAPPPEEWGLLCGGLRTCRAVATEE